MLAAPTRPRSTLLSILLLWLLFYASFTLFTPPLLDDADSVHAEVAREMLLRHDYVTLYANGIRYLEKAPLLYWSMALSMKLAMLLGAASPRALAAAARVPAACDVLGLALVAETFARRLFRSTRAGLYAALILLSSFGLFLFSHITLPDAGVCLWIALALYFFWLTEEQVLPARILCYAFAGTCALNVLTKGLIGIVFPVGIVLLYLLLTRGPRRAFHRLRGLHPLTSLAVFLTIAAPWHILAGLANPTQGHPAAFHFVNGHWLVPLPTDGNVRGWFWFYFMNEHVLRYLNLRVPHDYDTVPLWLFWGLCFVWMMPWSAFIFKATASAFPWREKIWRSQLRRHDFPLKQRGLVLLVVWAAFVLLFFSLSTRQEYYVLPAFPALALLIAGWLSQRAPSKPLAQAHRISGRRCVAVLVAFGTLFAGASAYLLLHTHPTTGNPDLSQLLQQNPGDYALSMGHFLDLNMQALSLFRLPLLFAAISLFVGPLTALLLRNTPALPTLRLPFEIALIRLVGKPMARWQGRKPRVHFANLALAAGAFGFLLAADLGLQTFSPVLTSAQLAQAIAPEVHPQDLVAIHGEYESGSTLGFYLQRTDIHIMDGRSSNLWYGSFFPDAPHIFETRETVGARWTGPQRIFVWQDTQNEDQDVFNPPGPVYILAQSGGKEILSNQPRITSH